MPTLCWLQCPFTWKRLLQHKGLTIGKHICSSSILTFYVTLFCCTKTFTLYYPHPCGQGVIGMPLFFHPASGIASWLPHVTVNVRWGSWFQETHIGNFFSSTCRRKFKIQECFVHSLQKKFSNRPEKEGDWAAGDSAGGTIFRKREQKIDIFCFLIWHFPGRLPAILAESNILQRFLHFSQCLSVQLPPD